MKSVLRFLVIIILSLTFVFNNTEGEDFASFKKFLRYYSVFPQLTDPFPQEVKTLSLKSSHPFWNGHFLDATKKIRKIKKDNEAGLIDGTLVMYHRFENNDLQIPAVMTFDWYYDTAIENNSYEELRKSFIKKIKNVHNTTNTGGKDLTLFNTQIGNTDLEISINGFITVNGDLVFENKDLVTTNQRDSKNWDLSIEQTQRFNIMGNIGDRFFIDIKQDSEADFTWENDLKIEYRGKENEILKKAEAGNINLNLAGMDAVSMGGNNSSLFGIKAVYQLGPVEMQSVIAREQVKKSEKTMTGGMSSGEPMRIKEYDFIVDRYFFIDEVFKNNYYPLTENNSHIVFSDYVIGNYEIYQFGADDGDPIYATAYVNPDPLIDETHSIPGSWKRLEENSDYEINRLYGYLRVNSSSSQNAIAIAYTITSYDVNTQTFGTENIETHTNFKEEYTDCVLDGNDDCTNVVRLKLIKDINKSTPSSPTWNLMFKNVYSLGSYDINADELEVDIVHDLGAGLETTHDENSGMSYLSIFGLDKENQSFENNPDGKIDLYESMINDEYGELILPNHMPFAYDTIPRLNSLGDTLFNAEYFPENNLYTYWGNNHEALQDILISLDDADGNFQDNDNGPAMYYDNNHDNSKDEHEFLIKVKTSSKSTSMDLGGFMIVEGSETVRLGSQILQKDIDYTIDYFSGQINFLNSDALDPSAEISVSYEENQIISFDQKFLMGTYMKYDFGEKNYLAGGMFYYNQSIAEEKVDIGYEPMRNFAWNLSGKYQNEWDFITKAVDLMPFVQTNKTSKFNIEGNYAQIIPNPNPLGQAFIDDFESSKKTSSISIMQRQWKMASPPDSTSEDSLQTLQTRGRMYWYNPYEDEPTQNIWPELSTSSQANNNTTKILEIETNFQSNQSDVTYWNGIMTPFYSSEYNQSQSKYLDIWLNANNVNDDELRIHVDIGHINEDWNDNGILDTEDEPVYGPGMGDGILSDGEDIGVDNCTNSYEDGWGSCLCNIYDNAYYESNLTNINALEDEYCIDPDAVKYGEVKYQMELNNPLYPPFTINLNVDDEDPNGDNWCYNIGDCGTSDYSQINGTEGNGQAMGYRYPDTEDMDNNKTLDIRNNYYTISINPRDTIMMVTETIKSDGDSTGWKLFRMPLSNFHPIGDISDWEDVRSFRLRIASSDLNNLQHLQIAKIELVENEWKELGLAIESDLNNFINEEDYFSVEVINTDESLDYKNSLYFLDDIIIEHDEYNDIDIKEQSLVLSFVEDPDNPDLSGLPANHAALIKNTFDALSNDQSLSYFAYEKMKMYVHGGDPESDNCNWCNIDLSEVDLLFRFGKEMDDNYYEIRQPIYTGWDDRNHVNINIDKLTQLKIPVINSPAEILDDVGLDGISNSFENGCFNYSDSTMRFGGGLIKTYDEMLDSLNDGNESFYMHTFNIGYDDSIIEEGEEGFVMGDSTFIICGEDWWNENCIYCSKEDPNGDNHEFIITHESSLFRNQNLDSEELPLFPSLNTEGNNQFDEKSIMIIVDGIEREFNYAEPAIEDYDGDGIYTPHPIYDYENNLYEWTAADNTNDINQVCDYCSELRIKGEPSINNIQNMVMGIVNNSSEKISGKVLVNELRMSGVKKAKETSYNISASLDFADLMTISGDYKHKDSGFHKLQQRLGTGSSDETYSSTIKLHPNIFLPHKWGVKTPMTLYYSNSIKMPKYFPGSDILTNGNNNSNIENIQSRDEKISFSSSFNKSTRSTNWLIKRTIDNISLSYSVISTKKSDSQIQMQTKEDYQISGNYNYNWGKENYFSPFKFTKNWIVIGNILGQARYYYTPEKFSTSIQFSESDKVTTQRSNNLNPTNTYSFNMQRKFVLNHKFTKTLTSNYTRQIDSNLDEFRYDKLLIMKNMNPGRVVAISEKFTNTFAPDFMHWLNPNITFNQTYTWSSSNGETANIKSSPTFKTKIGFNIQDFIELIYTPDNKGKSSKGRGRSRSTSSKTANNNKINIKNPFARLIIGKIHLFASKLKSISSTYTYSTSHSYDNVSVNLNPLYSYKFGFQESPVDEYSELSDTSLTNNNLLVTSSHSYSTDVRTNTSFNITKSILANLDYAYAKTLAMPSTASITENKSFSYFPLGNRGDMGFPFTNWSINWSKIEKLWILDKYFKSISLNHGFTGEQSRTFSNSELQNEEYKLHYSPLIGINSTTKGHNPITLTANYNLNQTIKNINESTERNHNNHITLSVKFKKTGGFKIDAFFFRDFYMRNNFDFAIDFDYNIDRKLITSSRVSSLDDFNEQTKNIAWSIQPNVSYSFTRWISGNFYFIYGITESKTSGRNEERDIGFNMNIKIQG